MWANAQRDGRPAEYRWRPLFNAAKFGSRPLLDYRAVTPRTRTTVLSRFWAEVHHITKTCGGGIDV